jgi:hypothetical protein
MVVVVVSALTIDTSGAVIPKLSIVISVYVRSVCLFILVIYQSPFVYEENETLLQLLIVVL